MLKRFPSYGRKPAHAPSFAETVRYHIVGRIHAGWLRPGDRLPSIRDMAARSGVDHRVAAEAYRQLERDGLVEVRPKSGVFVSASFSPAAVVAPDCGWVADVLFEAWQRGISRSSICGLLGGMLASPLRAGCIESNEDHMVALTGELADGLSLETVPILIDPSAGEGGPPPPEIDGVDVLVTSVFHTQYARAVAARAGKPLAVLTLRKEFSDRVGRRLAAGPVTAVIADRRYERVARAFFGAAGYAPPVRFVLADDAVREGLDLTGESVLVTRAARRRLGMEEYHLVPGSTVSPESARALCEIVTRVAPRSRPRPSPAPAPERRQGLFGGDARPPSAEPQIGRAAIVAAVEKALRDQGLFEALRVLNATTTHRFTGIYRFEPQWMRSYMLFDRKNPDLRIGADVPMKESYCALVADAGEPFRIENASEDPRLAGHAARNAVLCYAAVQLLDARGKSWGTLCHYDFRPAAPTDEELRVLEAVCVLIQNVLPPAIPHALELPECGARAGDRPLLRLIAGTGA